MALERCRLVELAVNIALNTDAKSEIKRHMTRQIENIYPFSQAPMTGPLPDWFLKACQNHH
jgi:hypothetical protein